MRSSKFAWGLVVIAAAIGFGPGSTVLAAEDAIAEPAWVSQARKIGQDAPARLQSVLLEEITRGDFAGAVDACREKAPAMAQDASARTGWKIRRVSLMNRNPKAVPDPWERAALEDFDRRAASNEPPERLERAEVVIENGQNVQRYMRALPMAEVCANCHGTADLIKPPTAARIETLYPQDRAVGYKVGEIRGAITLQRVAP